MAKRLIDSRLHEIRRLLSNLQRRVDDRISDALIALKDPYFAIASNAEQPEDEVESLASGREELEELFEHVLGDLDEKMSAMQSSLRELEAQILIAINLKKISDAMANRADKLVFLNTGSHIAVRQLLEVAVKMSEPELDRFVDQLMALRTHQRAPRLSEPESELLVKINQGVAAELQNRYDGLVAKRQEGNLTEAEYAELLALTEQVEELDARRVGYLAELARLRNTNLQSIMQDLGITPPPYG